tara:strand:- start:3710 stop:4189 length:480 start_codon:yes stop_codon:yes gene_type:complete
MEYTTEDIYWEEGGEWFKSKANNYSYYFHNDEVSCWHIDKKLWSGKLEDKREIVEKLIWKKADTRFIRDCIKINHTREAWKGRMEYPHLEDGYGFGNQATKYVSALGKGDRRRFTLLLDDDLYEEVVVEAQSKGMRRNTFLNSMIREVYEEKVSGVGVE